MATQKLNAEGALPEVGISGRAARRIDSGVLWVFSNEVEERADDLPAVHLCRFTHGGRLAAIGYFNRHSLIAGRVLARGDEPDFEALIVKRLREAFLRRAPMFSGGALRLVFSEADLLPGLVVDIYPPYAVVQSNTAGMDLLVPMLLERVPGLVEEVFGLRLQGLVLRCDAGVRRLEAVELFNRICFGDPEGLAAAVLEEDGVRCVADLIGGQKTGFFLDQRENRRFLAGQVHACGVARVLDLCCYSGAWGLRALQAGAAHVTFVDQSREALELLQRGLAANRVAPGRAAAVQKDLFDFLTADPVDYDIVVADPPAFVKSRRNLAQAAKAYQKLNRLAWRRLRPGGLLITCSCSHLISPADFIALLAAAVAKENGLAQVVYRGGQAEDHPLLLSMPETGYLKCVGLRRIRAA
ncbi:MAG: class I SAM-dependent rRNA methyltransferase [Desulfobacterales bacterium]